MTDGEILKKAIIKAEETGWAGPTNDSSEWLNFEAIIFDHSFAKALWGEKGATKPYEEIEHDGEHKFSRPNGNKVNYCKTCLAIKEEEGRLTYEDCGILSDDFTSDTPCLCGQFHIAERHGFYSKGWRHHLFKMVLEEKPIKYLEHFI